MEDYPSDWDRRRKKVYRRDGYKCQDCGKVGGRHGDAELHAHHKVPKSRGGSHEISNLVTLCQSCHNNVHNHTIGENNRKSGRASRVKENSNGTTEGFIAYLIFIFLSLFTGILLGRTGLVLSLGIAAGFYTFNRLKDTNSARKVTAAIGVLTLIGLIPSGTNNEPSLMVGIAFWGILILAWGSVGLLPSTN